MSTSIHTARVTGPCGDTMHLTLRLDGGRICSVSGETDGCGGSWQAVTAVCGLVQDRDLEQARLVTPAQVAAVEPGLPDDHLHCARLAVITLRRAIDLAAGPRCCGSSSAPCEVAACASCTTTCAAEAVAGEAPVVDGSAGIPWVLLVLSGKGGVGKSSVAVGLAEALAAGGSRIGLLDADVHGPSLPRLCGLRGQGLCHGDDQALLPQMDMQGVHLCSSGLLVDDEARAFIQRGPAKSGLIMSMLRDVAWGRLDGLVVDLPPGTGDEALTVAQHLAGRVRSVLVTTPHDLAYDDVRRCLSFCETIALPVRGVIENMAVFRCPGCGQEHAVFPGSAGDRLSAVCHKPVLGRLPLCADLACGGSEAWGQAMTDIAMILSTDLPSLSGAARVASDCA